MNIAIKLIIFTVIFSIVSLMLPTNILGTIGIPLDSVETFVSGVATFISNLCSIADVFLVEGSALLMVKAFTIFVFFYVQIKAFMPIIKLLAY